MQVDTHSEPEFCRGVAKPADFVSWSTPHWLLGFAGRGRHEGASLASCTRREVFAMTRPRRARGPSVQSPLETYLREINETPLLNAEDEKTLAYRIRKGEPDARDRMVRANLRLVVNIARS